MAKLFASQVAERVASQAVEWCGGVGFTKEFPLEKVIRLYCSNADFASFIETLKLDRFMKEQGIVFT